MSLVKKSNPLYGLFLNRCPRCHQGKFWMHNNPYVNLIRYKGAMHETCSHCQLKYEKEIGFWYGAMFISYALNIGLFVTMWLLWAWIYPKGVYIPKLVLSIMLSSLLFFPVVYHFSRPVWIRLFVRYEPGA